MEHPAVAEAGVIGKPDPVAMEVVKAFVSLKQGFQPAEELRRELLAFARTRLGAVVALKEIEFRDRLPRTRSGKIMRRLLKSQELRLPVGDTSTLEANLILSNTEPIASARIRCTTPNCIEAKKKSRNGKRDARSTISRRSCANTAS
jgi:hypothetical protein